VKEISGGWRTWKEMWMRNLRNHYFIKIHFSLSFRKLILLLTSIRK
jgi:hypothetical protein